jgi:subtilisin-like proprotein convertase family protein
MQKSNSYKPHLVLQPLDPLFVPQDTLYNQQWHFSLIGSIGRPRAGGSRAGIEAVWTDYRGQGIKVGIWDDGVQSNHPDLVTNYNAQLQVTINGTLNNGQPLTSMDGHGTSVAGLIGATGNNSGVVGVAYESQLTGVRIFGGQDDINANWGRYLQTLDYLVQFDVTNHSYGGAPNFIVSGDVAKFANASSNGRNGLGTINVKSAGNSNIDGNGDALDASRHTITVAATDSNGQITSYSTYGAHILVAAPAASVTTDLMGSGNGYDGLPDNNYTNAFGGTSAAGPVTAGLVSLMLSANQQLGWRDVQNILSHSAIGVGSLYGGVTTNENASWKLNGATNWNGGGMHFSEDYGYGLVNAFGAVRMAEVWSIIYDSTPLTSSNELMVTTGNISVNSTILDQRTLTYAFNVIQDISLEHVNMNINLTHSYFTDLRIRLISPKGTTYRLYDGSSGNASSSDLGLSYDFGIEGLRGESSQGLWTLEVQDAVQVDSGVLNAINFTGYGSSQSVNDVYHYTEEALDVLALAGQAGRVLLSDIDGGNDWINAAAMSHNLVLSLQAGASSLLAGQTFLTIANNGSLLENAAAGDGNDIIQGNDANNRIYGGRGNDVMYGGNGNDTAIFRGLHSDYLISFINGLTSVVGSDGSDQLSGFEYLQFIDQTVNDPSGGISAPDTIAPILQSSSPADNAALVGIAANISLTFNEDILLGSGNITLSNGAGDTRVIAANDLSQVSANGRVVTINPSNNLAYSSGYYLQVGIDAISDTSGNDFLISNSTTLNFVTESNITTINGTNAANTLNGTSGRDVINGLDGNDRLNGLAGDDWLVGGLGRDTLSGGAGSDVFIFTSTSQSSNNSNRSDVITDFLQGQEKIDLSAIDAFARTNVNDAFVWRGTSAFSSNTAGEVRYQRFDNAGTANDYTMVWVDNDADTQVEMSIQLTGLYNLATSDFIL